MKSIKFYLVLALMVTFLAGLATGRLKFFGEKQQPERRNRASWMCDKLNLTGDQRQKVLDIWKKASEEAPPPPFEKFRELDRECDSQIDAVLSTEQRERVKQIKGECDKKKSEMNAAAHAVFKRAQDETRAVLNPEQRDQYDRLLADMSRRRGQKDGPKDGPPPPR